MFVERSENEDNTIIETQNAMQDTSDFENMTVEQLNDYITVIKEDSEEEKNKMASDFLINLFKGEHAIATTNSFAQTQLRLAWIAAACIAEKKGYTCAAELVKHSVANTKYYENSIDSKKGLFYNKLLHLHKFQNMCIEAKNCNNEKNQVFKDSLEFTKDDNEDLFYALHNVDFTGYKNKQGVISDIFDFKLQTNMNDMFSTIVNDWAWLCQNTSVLNKINVKIAFSYK